jgi:hypothetical protein
MTILATHFSLVLGAWRLRVRIDLDEPREADVDESSTPRQHADERANAAQRDLPSFAPWGRG